MNGGIEERRVYGSGTTEYIGTITVLTKRRSCTKWKEILGFFNCQHGGVMGELVLCSRLWWRNLEIIGFRPQRLERGRGYCGWKGNVEEFCNFI